MGVAVGDDLGRLLGGGIERQRLIGAIVLLEWLLGVGAVDRTRGREHEVPARMRAQRLQQVEGADDIGVEIRARILGGVAHAGLRGEMDHDVGFSLGHSAREPHGIQPLAYGPRARCRSRLQFADSFRRQRHGRVLIAPCYQDNQTNGNW